MQELTYEGITSHSIDILLKYAAVKGDDKLSSYLGKHFDELVQLYTPLIKDLLDAYFEAPLSEYGPIDWIDPWEYILDILPWSEIEMEE